MASPTLDFEVIGGHGKDNPAAPSVRAHLKTWRQKEGSGVLLTPMLVTEAEIDDAVGARVAEWQELGTKMKQALRVAKKAK